MSAPAPPPGPDWAPATNPVHRLVDVADAVVISAHLFRQSCMTATPPAGPDRVAVVAALRDEHCAVWRAAFGLPAGGPNHFANADRIATKAEGEARRAGPAAVAMAAAWLRPCLQNLARLLDLADPNDPAERGRLDEEGAAADWYTRLRHELLAAMSAAGWGFPDAVWVRINYATLPAPHPGFPTFGQLARLAAGMGDTPPDAADGLPPVPPDAAAEPLPWREPPPNADDQRAVADATELFPEPSPGVAPFNPPLSDWPDDPEADAPSPREPAGTAAAEPIATPVSPGGSTRRPAAVAWEARCGGALHCSPDFTTVRFRGKEYVLRNAERAVVKHMVETREGDRSSCSQEELLDAVGSPDGSIRDLMKRCPLWQTLIVSQVGSKGRYILDLTAEIESEDGSQA